MKHWVTSTVLPLLVVTMLIAVTAVSWDGLRRAKTSMADTGLCTATRVVALLFGSVVKPTPEGGATIEPMEKVMLSFLTTYVAASSDLLPSHVRVLSLDGDVIWGYDALGSTADSDALFGDADVVTCELKTVSDADADGNRQYGLAQPMLRNGRLVAVLEIKGLAGPAEAEAYQPYEELRFNVVTNLAVLWIGSLVFALVLGRTVRRQERQLRNLALHDGLTGLANRRLLEDRLEVALRQSTRSGRAVAVVLVDLDRFKPINDTFGHDAGDRYLQEVARRLSASVRSSDTVGRIGGDEFVVVSSLIDGGPEELASRLRSALDTPFELVDGVLTATPASLGIVVTAGEDVNPADLLRRADLAMYEQKRTKPSSRGMVLVADGPAALLGRTPPPPAAPLPSAPLPSPGSPAAAPRPDA